MRANLSNRQPDMADKEVHDDRAQAFQRKPSNANLWTEA
jgi:hypothetical protein